MRSTEQWMNETMKAVIWRDWRNGSAMSQIASALNKPPATVFSYLWYHGGMQPRQRCRSLHSLTITEREEISRGLARNLSLRTIATLLGRSPSTISREVDRNGGSSVYRAAQADKAAWKRGKRPKQCLLEKAPHLKNLVARKLAANWSPEQISGWLKLAYAGDESKRVSHETIYKSLYIQTRGLFRRELRTHLRTQRMFRQAKSHRTASRGPLRDGVSISERPALVEDRAVPGHWEGDLICGAANSYIATVVERQTRFTILVKVGSKETECVVKALTNAND